MSTENPCLITGATDRSETNALAENRQWFSGVNAGYSSILRAL